MVEVLVEWSLWRVGRKVFRGFWRYEERSWRFAGPTGDHCVSTNHAQADMLILKIIIIMYTKLSFISNILFYFLSSQAHPHREADGVSPIANWPCFRLELIIIVRHLYACNG